MFSGHVPHLLQRLTKNLIWVIPEQEPIIYLTFDDGPIPGVTPWALDILDKYNARATFFAVGDNARKHPKLLEKIRQKGHQVGNHTFHHLNGWNYSLKSYLKDMNQAMFYLNTQFFRPPHGKISSRQIAAIKNHYYIIMWTILTRDYDSSQHPEDLLKSALKHTQPGAIVVFHDSLKARKNMMAMLPEYLRILSHQGYIFKPLNQAVMLKYHNYHNLSLPLTSKLHMKQSMTGILGDTQEHD